MSDEIKHTPISGIEGLDPIPEERVVELELSLDELSYVSGGFKLVPIKTVSWAQ